VSYDPAYIASFYDAYGEREWERLEGSVMDRVNFEVHKRLLDEFVRPGDRVLEVGAGPGRFTLELARIGARVVVGDISPGQLELHAEKTAGVEDAVEARELMDVVDLSRYDDERFDATVCYGGAISYVFDHAERAVSELLRVTKPGGPVLLSVMSTVGTTRAFFSFFPGLVERFGTEANEQIFRTGVLEGEINNGHNMRMYRWRELEQLILRAGARVVAASAANFLSVGNEDAFETDWPRYLEWEIEACREPGALDGGTHIVAVIVRDGAAPSTGAPSTG